MNTLNEYSTILLSSREKVNFPRKHGAKKKLAVLMSGGVDSSVAALLLQRQGFDIAGVTMELFAGENSTLDSAAEVCGALAIPHFSVNISDEFKKLVISPFCGAYLAGDTPNPCAVCNERIKFGVVIDLMEQIWGGDFDIATGHYARIVREGRGAFLARAEHKIKDQSYFLSGIKRGLLSRLHFPLGGLSGKEEVREIARKAVLPVAEKTESMEICFAAQDNYRKIIGETGTPGPIVDLRGNVLGAHKGLAGYTYGQRKGLGITASHPLFVVGIRTGDNTLVVAPREEAFEKNVTAGCLNILIEDELKAGKVLWGKIRSQGEPLPCTVISREDGSLTVEFNERLFAPAPGQRLVLYTSGGLVAAGGVITRGKI